MVKCISLVSGVLAWVPVGEGGPSELPAPPTIVASKTLQHAAPAHPLLPSLSALWVAQSDLGITSIRPNLTGSLQNPCTRQSRLLKASHLCPPEPLAPSPPPELQATRFPS